MVLSDDAGKVDMFPFPFLPETPEKPAENQQRTGRCHQLNNSRRVRT